MAPIFRSPTHAPLKPGDAAGMHPVGRTQADHHRLEIAHVAMDVLSIRLEVEDRIADQLSRAVIGDVAAASGLDDLDAARGQRLGGGDDVRPGLGELHAERDDMGMFEQQQRVGDAIGAPVFDEGLLQVERFAVGDQAEAADSKSRTGTLHDRDRAIVPNRAIRASRPTPHRTSRASPSPATGTDRRRRRRPGGGRSRASGTPSAESRSRRRPPRRASRSRRCRGWPPAAG